MSFRHISEIIEELIAELTGDRGCHCQHRFDPRTRGDSVLEDAFWHMLRKTDLGWHAAIDQFEIGRYRVDCLMDCNGKLVVVELDGKAYHRAEADQLRDAEILKSVDAIIRIPFPAMWYYRYATFKVLGEWFPRLGLHADYQLVLSMDEFKDEWQRMMDDPEVGAEYFNEAERSYNIWEKEGDIALVGSPSAFRGGTNLMSRVWVQRGTQDPGLMERLYERTGCKHLPAVEETAEDPNRPIPGWTPEKETDY